MLLLVVTAQGGCLSASGPDIKTYVLDANIDPRPGVRSGNKVLLVAMPRAQPGYDNRGIAYTLTPLALDYYASSEWADTPARMLAPLLVTALESTGAFQAVVTPPTPVVGDLRLDVDIIRFQHEFLEQPSRVRIALRAKLFDTANGQVLGVRLFEAAETALSEDAYGGVQAANLAVKRLLEQVTDFVLRHQSYRSGRAFQDTPYLPVGSTATAVPQTVLITASRSTAVRQNIQVSNQSGK